jgi:hypothetical protein
MYFNQSIATAPTYFEYKHIGRSSINRSSGICLLHIQTFLYFIAINHTQLKDRYVTSGVAFVTPTSQEGSKLAGHKTPETSAIDVGW